jgi:hypothetical protein
MSLNVNPGIESLIAVAQANGVSVEAFLKRVVEEHSGLQHPKRLSPQEWSTEFETWADSFPEAPEIPDEALLRENLYSGERSTSEEMSSV